MTQSPIEQALSKRPNLYTGDNKHENELNNLDILTWVFDHWEEIDTALRQHREDGVCVPKTGRFKFTNCTDLELPEEKQTCFITGTIEYAPPPQKERD